MVKAFVPWYNDRVVGKEGAQLLPKKWNMPTHISLHIRCRSFYVAAVNRLRYGCSAFSPFP